MSNLGWYQLIVTLAKKCGGPGLFLLGVMLIGYGVFRTVEGGIKLVAKNINADNEIIEYAVTKNGVSNEGVEFNVGDRIRAFEKHGNAILIERVGDNNNPYFIDENFLKSII